MWLPRVSFSVAGGRKPKGKAAAAAASEVDMMDRSIPLGVLALVPCRNWENES